MLVNISAISVKSTLDFKSDIQLYEKQGEVYMNLVNRVVNTNLERGYYYFENLKSATVGMYFNRRLIRNFSLSISS